MIEYIIPENQEHWLRLRSQDITSTEISALFGLNPYMTEFEVWHRHKNEEILELEPQERMKWGQRLQDTIAHGIAEDQGWKIRRMPEYARDPLRRIGSSFDFAIGDEGLLEIKNVDIFRFKDSWIDEGSGLEAPPDIELQIQHQLAISGKSYAYIGALIGGNNVQLIRREPDEKIIKQIRLKVGLFWISIMQDMPPEPDLIQDAEMISKLYNVKSGKVLDARSDKFIAESAIEYSLLGEQIKALEEKRKACKSKILLSIGDNEKCIGENFSISASMVDGAEIESYYRSPYRRFSITMKKDKK